MIIKKILKFIIYNYYYPLKAQALKPIYSLKSKLYKPYDSTEWKVFD